MALVVALAFSGCTAEQESPLPPGPKGELRIVSSLPDRGLSRADAEEARRAIDLAIAQRTHEIPVVHVALSGSDDETGGLSRKIGEHNALAAAQDPAVVAYIGPWTSEGTAISLPITNRAGLLHFGISATWPGLTQPGWNAGEPQLYFPTGIRNFVRLVPPDSVQAVVAARDASAQCSGEVIPVVDGSTYSAGMASAFSAEIQRLGRAAVAPVLAPSGVPSRNDFARLRAASCVYFGPSSVQVAVRFSRSVPATLPIFWSDVVLDPQFVGQVEGTPTHWVSTANDGAQFVEDAPGDRTVRALRSLREAFGREPSRAAVASYLATEYVLDAIAAGARDRQSVLLASRRFGDGSDASFDEQGDPRAWTMRVLVWREGLFRQSHVVREP